MRPESGDRPQLTSFTALVVINRTERTVHAADGESVTGTAPSHEILSSQKGECPNVKVNKNLKTDSVDIYITHFTSYYIQIISKK